MSRPLITFDVFSLVAEYPLLENRRPDAIIQMNVPCYIYDRPFLRSFLHWCRQNFTIGVSRKSFIAEYLFGNKVTIDPCGFVVPLDFYNPTKYDTQLSENGYIRLWLQKFLDYGVSSLEEFAKENPYTQPKPYKQGEYNPPTSAHYGQVSVPRSIDMPKFVGRDGFHLKRITELSHCEYLWFDTSRHVVEIWGSEFRIPKAQRMLERRIKSLVSQDERLSTEFQVPDGVKVIQKNVMTRSIQYTITGPEALCMQLYLGEILSRYPTNPYFTKIEKKEQTTGGIKMIVTRSSTSD